MTIVQTLVDPLHGDGYQVWSGILGSFIMPRLDVLAGLALWWHRHNCHAQGCYRIGRHPVAGTQFVVCAHHHPSQTITRRGVNVDRIHAQHKRFLARAGL